MPKDTREKVTLSPEAYKALEVEAMLHGSSLKDTASKLILKAACPKCKEILDIMARPAKEPKDTITQEPDVIIAKEPKGTKAQIPDGPKAKRQRLSQDHVALAKIKELWNAGEHNVLIIAKEIGYSKSTTWENIKKLKDKGEIVETTK
jgi:phage FluMu protein Com